jgi:4-oxalomesaconate tautomerase
MSLLSPPQHGGAVSTRTFIPHRVHEAIGVFGAVSVATACVLPGSVAHEVAVVPGNTVSPGHTVSAENTVSPENTGGPLDLEVEHPTGFFTVTLELEPGDGIPVITRSALLRTARLLMRGEVMVPASVWDPASGGEL